MKMYIVPNISRSKDNQTMKCGQLISYNKRIVFIQKHTENKAARLVPDLSLFFNEALVEVKTSGVQLSFYIFC